MRKITLFSFRELIVILLSGGIPIILAYQLGGITELEKTIEGLMAPKILLYYCLAPPLFFAIVFYSDKYIYIDPVSKTQGFLNFIISVFHELSSNIIGIFRLSSGLLMTFPFLVLAVEPEAFIPIFFNFFFFGLVAWAEVTLFYWWFSKLNLKQRF